MLGSILDSVVLLFFAGLRVDEFMGFWLWFIVKLLQVVDVKTGRDCAMEIGPPLTVCASCFYSLWVVLKNRTVANRAFDLGGRN